MGVNLSILSGGDCWLNLVQWFALVLTALTGSLIARDLGGSSLLQAVTALLVVSIPTAALQAENTKNDVATAFFFCALAYFSLRVVLERDCPTGRSLLLGVALGLLLLTKGTGLIFGLPVCLWLSMAWWRIGGGRRTLAVGSCVFLVAVTLNAGHFTRNYLAFGSLVGLPEANGGVPLSNTRHDVRALLSNVQRNISMHLALPFLSWNEVVHRSVSVLHQVLKIDMNDPTTTFYASAPFGVFTNFADEDRATAPVQVGLVLFTVGLLCLGCFRGENIWLKTFRWIPVLAFLLFCLVLKWQEWHPRLHIPILCLSVPVVVSVMGTRFLPALVVTAFLAFDLTFWAVLHHEMKPLVGKNSIFAVSQQQLRLRHGEIKIPVEEVTRVIQQRQPRVIGFMGVGDYCDYAWHVIIFESLNYRPQLVQLDANLAQNMARIHAIPDLIVHRLEPHPETISYDSQRMFRRVGVFKSVGLYVPAWKKIRRGTEEK